MTLGPFSRRGHALEGVSRDGRALRFVARLLEGETMAALCEEFGISRKTGYKIFQRYRQIGVQGLTDRSRRPVSARESAADGGREDDRPAQEGVSRPGARPRSASGSGSAGPRSPVPRSARCMRCSTGTGWCGGAGARRRPRLTGTPLSRPVAPNRLWCADYKGEFLLGNQRYCYPLTITDFASRYLLACEALSTTKERYAFTRLRAGVSGVWPARRHSHGQRRALRVRARALRT